MHMRLFFISLVLILFCISLTAHTAPIKRTILILYSSYEDETDIEIWRQTRYAPVVLNRLGLKVRYHDIDKGLPPESKLDDVRGILTWFESNDMAEPTAYIQWLERQVNKGTKLVIFGDFGAASKRLKKINPKTKEPVFKELKPQVYQSLFSKLGLEYKGHSLQKTLLIQILKINTDMFHFEKDLIYDLNLYTEIRSISDKNKVHLNVKLRGRKQTEADMVVTGPWGGFAAHGTILQEYTRDPKQKGWYLNPFKYFAEAFDIKQDMPRADVTTLFGNRVLYTHIDGDGFNNLSHLDFKSISGKIVYEQVLKKYKIPHTVSVIVGEIDTTLMGSKKSLHYAKEIFKLPYVEAASHGYGHPLDWVKKDVGVYQMAKKTAYKKANYETEIKTSVNWINKNLLTPPKKVKIFLWTGQTNPPEEALKIPYEIGIKNLNGGDAVRDQKHPSIMGLAPLTRQKGNFIQPFTSNANENIYTNEWTGPFYGFKDVIATFKSTESPIRYSPMNIYYHFFIGERKAALASLYEVYDYALSQPHFGLYATDYVSMVEGFYAHELEPLKGGWKISNPGAARTFRVENTKKYPNFSKSKGIIGFMHFQNALYVYLSDKGPYELYLTKQNPKTPYLASSNVHIKNFKQTASQMYFQTSGIVDALIKVKNLKPNQIVKVKLGLKLERQKTDAHGELTLRFNLRNSLNVSIKI